MRKFSVAFAMTLLLGLGAQARAEEPAAASSTPVLGVPIDFSGEFWLDTGYRKDDLEQDADHDQKAYYQQGRFVLGAAYTRTVGELTATAKAEFLGLISEYSAATVPVHVQDAWVKIGGKNWDVQAGRLLAKEVYYRGQGIDLYSAEEGGVSGAPTLYWVTYNRGQERGAGQVAVHYNPLDTLGLEFAGVYGFNAGTNSIGVRPAFEYTLGAFKALGAYEWRKNTPVDVTLKGEDTQWGYGGRVQYKFPIVTLYLNGAHTRFEKIAPDEQKDADNSYDQTSVGAVADVDFWKNSIGLGYHYTVRDTDSQETQTQQQVFVSYKYYLPIDGLSIKGVFGYGISDMEDTNQTPTSTYQDLMYSYRIRVAYEFK